MKTGIVVVGSSNTDMVVKSPRLPSPGETVLGGEFVMAAGGKGANQAVAAARLGGNVALVARIGSDLFGEKALENFRADGIRTDSVFCDPAAASGVALIMVGPEGENMISVASGANARLDVEDINRAADEIEAARVVLIQLEIPLEAVTRAAELGKESGAVVILNPAPAQPLDPGILQNTTILTPNETETEILTGILPADNESALAAADRLHEMGVETVIITRGAEGVLVSGRAERFTMPVFPVEAVDTTAAGDAFNGALAFALAGGKALLDAVRFAGAVAAISVTRMGAQPSLPSIEEVEEFLQRRT